MPFIKGETGNKKGRPVKNLRGSPEALRNELHEILNGLLPQIKKDLKVLKSRDRVLMFERLARYIMPGPGIDLSKLSERDLDILILRLKEKLNNGTETRENSGS